MMDIDESFARGELVHPGVGAPNSVHLFRAVSRLAGGAAFEETKNTRAVAELVGHHDHYLFVLVDGLGMGLRNRFPSGGLLASAPSHTLHSVFPSTTAVALTSLATGCWPSEHGFSGWWTYFPEHRRVLAPLTFRERGTKIPAEELGLSMDDLVSSSTVLGSCFRTVHSVLPREITGSAYAHWSRGGTPVTPYGSFRQARRILARHYRRVTGPTYTYLYVLTVDAQSHAHGVASDQVAAEVARVDRLLTRVRESIPPSVRMVVTADHGLVDVPAEQRFAFRDSDPLARHLVAGQTGDTTSPVFHVRPGARDAFLEAFAAHPASEYFTLYTPGQLHERGLYGPTPLSQDAVRHLGDYVGIAREPALLEYVPAGDTPVAHVGVHGGLRPEEMQVPLLIG